MDIKSVLNSIDIKNDIAVMNIYGDIVSSEWDRWSEEDICPGFVSDFLNETKGKELHVHINSGGGSAFAGVAIYNLLKAREGKTVTYVDALAASAASVIALAGDEMIMPTGAMLMIHKPWSVATGNSDELRKLADDLDKIAESYVEVYKDNLVNTDDLDKIKEMMAAETWLSAEDCTGIFKNAVAETGAQACACVMSESIKHYKLPSGIKFENDVKKPDGDELEKMKMELEIEEALLM